MSAFRPSQPVLRTAESAVPYLPDGGQPVALVPGDLVGEVRADSRVASRSPRIAFIDLARAFAVLFMVQGHALNVLLHPSYAQGVFADSWLFLRGLTSCMFLTLSGTAFAVATSRRWESHLRWSGATWRRLRRFAFFAMLGYVMHLPVSRLSHFPFVSAEGWQSFFAVDILQMVGLTLIGLQLLVMLSTTRLRFAVACAVLGVGAVVATPAAWSTDWTGRLPVAVAAYLTESTGSLFPLLPWIAFVFAGVIIGLAYETWGKAGSAAFAWRVLMPLGLGALVLGLVLHGFDRAGLGTAAFERSAPSFFLVRMGGVLLLLSGFAVVGQGLVRVPTVVTALSQESLTIYFLHVCVLYGSIWGPGLRQAIGPQLGPTPTLGWIAALLLGATLVAWTWYSCKRAQPRLATMIRLATVAAFFYSVS